jgi:tRNA-uridine 2-sulfurtransferase
MSELKTVAVGMSGGVDSSVAAALLLKKGYKVIGVTMAIWDGSIKLVEGIKHSCYGPGEEEEIETVKKICSSFGIPHFTVDLKKEYHKEIISYFKREYLAGRTPNPCVMCNYRMKFGFLIEKARLSGVKFDHFATGHYVRAVKENGEYVLKKALDASKDQTYFLQGIKREIIKDLIFPLGELTKENVRQIAREMGLEVAERAESQDFIAGEYGQLFDNDKLPHGDIVNEKGEILGRHRGIVHYTVGQRKGLGISNPTPLYVLRIDAGKNKVVVTDKEHLFSNKLTASNFNYLLSGEPPSKFKVKARIRQKHKEADAIVEMMEKNRIRVVFDDPQLSITPGQAVALYKDDILMGGGLID